jgi:hypothetical protein
MRGPLDEMKWEDFTGLCDTDVKLVYTGSRLRSSRSRGRTSSLRPKGHRGSFEQPTLFSKVLEGAEALFWLAPPRARADYYAWATKCGPLSCEKAGTRRAIVISSVGTYSHMERRRYWAVLRGNRRMLLRTIFGRTLSLRTTLSDCGASHPTGRSISWPRLPAEVSGDKRYSGTH